MNIRVECVPCLLNQALSAARVLGLGDRAARRLMLRCAEELRWLKWDEPAPLMGRRVHRILSEVTGDPDPYRGVKDASTDAALALLPGMEAVVAAAPDPFLAAVRVAIAGNVIDFGTGGRPAMGVEEAASTALSLDVDEATVESLRRRIGEAQDVLFLADNAGELVFDRPLLDLIGADKVTVVVRGGPVINDATLRDARRAGLTDRYTVVTSGVDIPGIWLPECSADTLDRFERADLVLSKGQGNFETLDGQARPVFFLFLVKCVSVASSLGVELHEAMVRTQ